MESIYTVIRFLGCRCWRMDCFTMECLEIMTLFTTGIKYVK